MPSNRPSPLIPLGDLARQSRHTGSAYRLCGPDDVQPFALRGRVQTHPMTAGATLHLVDVVDEHAQNVHIQLKPGLRIAWVLRGRADVRYGSQRVLMQPGRGGPTAHAVALAEGESFTRYATPGGRESTVSLCLTPDWLAQAACSSADAVSRLSQQHLQCAHWQAPPALHAVLQGLLGETGLAPELHALYLQGCFQMLAAHALQGLAGPDAGREAAAPLRRRPMEQVRELLDSGQADRWSLEAIARHHHMSAATLQRHFQQAFGMGVFAYQRRRRLQQARAALARGEVDVAGAAALAGYRHAANFSTAFRRQFGISPLQARG
ncbi:AraC family transcriptional regulator [Allofranklinella schreckenbergeri]|uniref:AraC family transcriptional regulator n=1 Tax=Allofranklinella schreckenbergeri TaxID=1076744 RepID=A0A3M6R7J5_9BURK|nr:AraC family transcriptional regulator [Allofranklinella schreckenbergeri]RMX10708.1 AraC family transcriptional regulator [Allofranklinella schreckenbergeri]